MCGLIDTRRYEGKRISVLGAGVSGTSLAELAKKAGADVFVSDAQELSLDTTSFFYTNGIRFESGGNTEKILDADILLVSSGISPENKWLLEAEKKDIDVIGELDFASQFISCPIIAVTGSNGKTTTTSMIGYLLEKSGYRTGVCGNIGNGISHMADGDYDFVVAELSSFQLHRASSFRCNVAVVTNLAPDHITWHGSYENYIAAKAKEISSLVENGIAVYQSRDEAAFCFRDDVNRFPLSWTSESEENALCIDRGTEAAYVIKNGKKTKLFDFDDINLLGDHNIENTAMTLAVLNMLGVSVPKEVLASYVPPKHRCAFAGKINDVTFVDDSKGTNVAATVTALTAINGTKVIILGGQGKGEEYSLLAETVRNQARAAVLIGEEKEVMAAALDKEGFTNYRFEKNMKSAVDTAYSMADHGDIVLLSPACTSWDMYPSYVARGEDYVRCVKELIEREA